MFPLWTYFAVAAVMALTAFAIGQVAPGCGVLFLAGMSSCWVVYCVWRGSRRARRPICR